MRASMMCHEYAHGAERIADASQEDDKPFEVRLSDESFETYELDPPPYTLDTTKAELKQIYYDMVAVRYAPSFAGHARPYSNARFM